MNPDTHEIEVPTFEGNAIAKPGDLITEVEGGFFIVGDNQPKPNREQRRKNLKAKEERLVVRTITVAFENGQTANLDPSKIMIVDKDTKANLFNYVMEKKA